MILQWVLFNVITCMVPTINAAMFRTGVNGTFSWGLEVCLTYGMATHKIVGRPPMANAIMGAKTWSVQACSAVKQHNSHHSCRSAFRIVSMCLMLEDAWSQSVVLAKQDSSVDVLGRSSLMSLLHCLRLRL